jgi:hypothetical protein
LARQAAAAGWSYVDLVARIVEDALTRERPALAPESTPPASSARGGGRVAQGMPYTQRLAPAMDRREPQRTRST